MSELIRKQIYIHRRHQRLLDELSRSRAVSQAEIIRQAIEREAADVFLAAPPHDQSAWDDLMRAIQSRLSDDATGPAYLRQRADAYEDREGRLEMRG